MCIAITGGGVAAYNYRVSNGSDDSVDSDAAWIDSEMYVIADVM